MLLTRAERAERLEDLRALGVYLRSRPHFWATADRWGQVAMWVQENLRPLLDEKIKWEVTGNYEAWDRTRYNRKHIRTRPVWTFWWEVEFGPYRLSGSSSFTVHINDEMLDVWARARDFLHVAIEQMKRELVNQTQTINQVAAKAYDQDLIKEEKASRVKPDPRYCPDHNGIGLPATCLRCNGILSVLSTPPEKKIIPARREDIWLPPNNSAGIGPVMG